MKEGGWPVKGCPGKKRLVVIDKGSAGEGRGLSAGEMWSR